MSPTSYRTAPPRDLRSYQDAACHGSNQGNDNLNVNIGCFRLATLSFWAVLCLLRSIQQISRADLARKGNDSHLMKAVLQRVSRASVTVDGEIIGAIDGSGYMILLGVEQGDTEKDSSFLAQKSTELRIFNDQAGKMNLSLMDVEGGCLVVSQFTLAADWRKGRRPGFSRAAAPAEAERLYLHFVEQLKSLGVKKVETGKFGADMKVELINDGPVTMLLENRFSEAAPTQ